MVKNINGLPYTLLEDTKKQVLLFSGGMDSTALRYLNPKATLLYFDMETEYSEQEKKRLPKDCIIEKLPLVRWERPDKIIPMRNLIVVSLASMYGNEILLGATAGDRVLDKSTEFMEMTSKLLSFLWKKQHWTHERKITITAPLKKMTKTQIMKECMIYGFAEAVATESFSCYTPTKNGKECGRCKPCFRKWVACTNVGITVPFHFEAMEYGKSKDVLNEIRSRDGEEFFDVQDAYKRIGVKIG